MTRTDVTRHLRSHGVSYVALLVALVVATSGSAVALPGIDTVFSDDIVNGEVRTADLADNAIGSIKIRDGRILRADLAVDSVDSSQIRSGAVDTEEVEDAGLLGVDIADNSLSGADVLESSLGEVPMATTALSGGTGRSGGTSGVCDPESATFVTCTSLGLTLAAPSRVLIIATVLAFTEGGADSGRGVCRVGTSVTGPIPGSSVVARTLGSNVQFTVMGITPVLNKGPILVGLDCNQDPSLGAISFTEAHISAVALSAN